MLRLLQEIKQNEFKGVYLLYGEEDYLRLQYKDRLREAVLGDADLMNYHYTEGKHASQEELIDLAETLPFFADRRVIVAENTGWFTKGGEKIAEYLAVRCPATYFIFVERQIDKRSKCFKAVSKYGRAVEFGKQEEETLKKWIISMVKKEEKQMTSSALSCFLEQTGQEMSVIKTEMEKLICYCTDLDIIGEEQVREIGVKRVQNRIFEMIESIGNKQRKQALLLYEDLLALKEPPLKILALMARQFNLMLQIKELVKKGNSQQMIAEKTGLPGFAVKKYMNQCTKFSAAELKQAVEEMVETEADCKQGILQDRLGVELLLVKYSS